MYKAILGLAVVASGALAASSVTITINNTPFSGLPGSTLTFNATMTNTAGVLENLSGDRFNLQAPFTLANINDSSFFITWPLSLAAGKTFGPQALFDITIPNGTAPGAFAGTFNLTGGPGPNDQNNLGLAVFQVNVVTPEPASGVLLLIGLGGFVARRRALQLLAVLPRCSAQAVNRKPEIQHRL